NRKAPRARRRVLREPQDRYRARRTVRGLGRVTEGQAGAEDAGLAGGDGQAEAVAAAGAVGAAGAEAAGALEQEGLGEAGAVIADAHHAALDRDLDGRFAVPGRVGDQVAEDAFQAPGV